MSNPSPDDARDLLAAEYVMGLTEPADLAQVEQMIMRDAGFASAVAAWRARLSPLDATAPQRRVDDRLWTSIEAALAGAPSATPAVAPPKPSVASDPARDAVANALRDVAPPPPREARAPVVDRPGFVARLWESLAFWRFAGLSGAFAATLLAAGLGYYVPRANRQPVLIAVLMTDSNQAAAVVNAYADGRAEMLPLMDIQVPEGKAIEIWTLWDRAVGPRSIGLIQRAGRTTLRLDNLPKPQPGQLFEMTLEPSSGSPTGRPTGPILNKGNATTAL